MQPVTQGQRLSPLLLPCSHFQAWCALVEGMGLPRAQRPAFRDAPRRSVLGAEFATWQEARGVAQACILCWRSRVLQGWADRQLRRVRAQQAFVAWRVALGRCREAQQAALRWPLELHKARGGRLGGAHAAQSTSAR